MDKLIKNTQFDRALGALLGGALGDALGMPSQTLTCPEIIEYYGNITDFIAPVEGHPVSHGLSAGEITDDTEQSVLLARLITSNSDGFDSLKWAAALLDWEKDVKERGLHDLLGPSTKRALDALVGGAPASETGKTGDTNGAAMRIGPVGIAAPIENIEMLVDHVEETCVVTHNTATAISSAAAVAATISSGIEGASFSEACADGILAAIEGSKRGNNKCGSNIVAQILKALDIVENNSNESAIEMLKAEIGTSVASNQSIPTAFGIAKIADGKVWLAGLLSANIGDDTDTIGAIACGMTGACSGVSSFPKDKLSKLIAVNNLTLDDLARDLLSTRAQRTSYQYLNGVSDVR